MKQKIAKYLLCATLAAIAVSYLPWIYMTVVYYVLRYAIMAFMASAVVLTFSIEKYFSERFMRLFLVTIALFGIEYVCFKLLGRRFVLSDLSQLVVAFLCVGIGIGIDEDVRFWANVSYYYTIILLAVTICNCFYWAGGLYVPEHYMLDKGKNQYGGMLAIASTVMFFFAVKLKEQRTHFAVVFALTLLVLLLIRARSDFFAMLLCVLFIAAKDCQWKWQWNVKSVLTVVGLCLAGYIIYNGFIGDELNTFMVGGKSSSDIEELSSHRMERNLEGMEFFLKDPLGGEQKEPSGILLIHNYILLRMVRYGVWSFPVFAFYFYFGIFIICRLFKNRKTDVRDAGIVACVVPLVVSFAEPNFPYGPGSVQMLAFLLLGATFQMRAKNACPSELAERNGKVLHISNDFANSKVHCELYQKLDQLGLDQVVYTPIRRIESDGGNQFEGPHTQIIYSYILRKYHRILFNLKIDKITNDIARKVDMSQISCVHATTLFSDGAVALQLKRRYGIPYVVAVRNTDVNDFLKLAPHLWWVHRAVIREADAVISITPALQQRIQNHWTLIGMRDEIQRKGRVIANGINDYWLTHLHLDAQQHAKSHRICYVGLFDDNKNVQSLVNAVLALKSEIPDIHLDLVGGNGNKEAEVLEVVKQHPDVLTYCGKIYEKDKLQEVYLRNSIFAMPSKTETFGLVYVEALSQGLSVLYTKGEGIDGLFEEPIGEKVDARSEESIRLALKSLIVNPERYAVLPAERFQQFDWSAVAMIYQKIYNQIFQNR